MFSSLDILDSDVLSFSESSLLIMNITIALIMFGVALEIKLDNFKDIIRNPKSIIVGIFSQFFLLPAVTFLLILIIQPTPSVALGMILVAACPGGNISNFITLLSKGNIALSVSLTAFATVAAIFMTPLNFFFWGNLYKDASGIMMPVSIDAKQMALVVFTILGIPLFLGILFAKRFPKLTKRITKPMKIFSIVAFSSYVVAALSTNFHLFLNIFT